MEHRREIDGLRAIAVLPVVLYHAGLPGFDGGYIGVDVFFVISGFLITSIILNDMAAGRFSLVQFYERRARRILPALFFVSLACVPFAWMLFLPDSMAALGRSLLAVAFFVSNFLFWSEDNYFGANAEEKPLLHTWSLAVEEQYYLFFPLLVMLLLPWGKKWLTAALLVGFMGSLAITEIGWRKIPEANYFLSPFRAWELAAGALLAVYLSARTLAGNDKLAFAGLALLVGSFVVIDRQTPFPSLYGLMPVAGTTLLLAFARRDNACGRLLGAPLFVGFGLISYSLYLWHQPIFAFAKAVSLQPPSELTYIVLTAVSIGAGWLSWRFVEAPFRDKTRWTRRGIFTMAGVGTITLAGVGYALNGLEGVPQRVGDHNRDLAVTLEEHTAFHTHLYDAWVGKNSFSDDGRPKLLVLGDSFSHDFMNVAERAVDLNAFDAMVYWIPEHCQVYLGSLSEAMPHIPPTNQNMCTNYLTDFPRAIADAADLILVASRWRQWSLVRLEETLERLKSRTDQRIVLVRRKEFGYTRRDALQHLTSDERPHFRVTPTPEHQAVRATEDEVFSTLSDRSDLVHAIMDLQPVFCTSADCRLFEEDGHLLSYDGKHLTERGTTYAAQAYGKEIASVFASAVRKDG